MFHDEAGGTVRVDDSIIREIWESPMPGKVDTDNRLKVRFTWTIAGMKNDKRPRVNSWLITRGFLYSASYWKVSGKFTVTMFDHSYGSYMGRIAGEGTCRVTP